jgi:hypothetical protein
VAGWVDARRIAHARRLGELAVHSPSLVPECELAGQSGRRQAVTTIRRQRLLDSAPGLETALGDGQVSGAHVDALERATRRLEPAQREELTGDQSLVLLAATVTPEQFDRVLAGRVRDLRTDDGVGELDRQRRDTELRMWRDQRTGMYRLSGSFDPESGLTLRARLEAAVDTLFHDRTPDTCPTDPELKQAHLRALALLALTAGTAGEASMATVGARTELVVIIDQQTLTDGPHPDTHVDHGDDGPPMPVETYRRWGCSCGLIPAVLDSDGVLLDLGRTVRVASKAQRRALAAMYASCAVPGCDVPTRHCEPHHVTWWRNGGGTELPNLLPLCSRHHHKVHEGGWTIALDSARRLTITHPDGTTTTGDPPGHQRNGPAP